MAKNEAKTVSEPKPVGASLSLHPELMSALAPDSGKLLQGMSEEDARTALISLATLGMIFARPGHNQHLYFAALALQSLVMNPDSWAVLWQAIQGKP